MGRLVMTLALLCVAGTASAGGIKVTPQMRRALTEKLTEQCLRQEADFAKKGYTRAQTVAICKCSMQQTGALLNSRTVSYILAHGVMPPDMERKAHSATRACVKANVGKP